MPHRFLEKEATFGPVPLLLEVDGHRQANFRQDDDGATDFCR